jgi:hypothetical protein
MHVISFVLVSPGPSSMVLNVIPARHGTATHNVIHSLLRFARVGMRLASSPARMRRQRHGGVGAGLPNGPLVICLGHGPSHDTQRIGTGRDGIEKTAMAAQVATPSSPRPGPDGTSSLPAPTGWGAIRVPRTARPIVAAHRSIRSPPMTMASLGLWNPMDARAQEIVCACGESECGLGERMGARLPSNPQQGMPIGEDMGRPPIPKGRGRLMIPTVPPTADGPATGPPDILSLTFRGVEGSMGHCAGCIGTIAVNGLPGVSCPRCVSTDKGCEQGPDGSYSAARVEATSTTCPGRVPGMECPFSRSPTVCISHVCHWYPPHFPACGARKLPLRHRNLPHTPSPRTGTSWAEPRTAGDHLNRPSPYKKEYCL